MRPETVKLVLRALVSEMTRWIPRERFAWYGKVAQVLSPYFFKYVAPVLLLLAGTAFVCNMSTTAEDEEREPELMATYQSTQTPETLETAPVDVPTVPTAPAPKVDPRTALTQYMDLCEDRVDTVEYDEKGNVIKKKKRRMTKSEQERMRRHITAMAKEMGAEPKLFLIWALRESSYRPYKRHLLDPDQEAAATAWRRFRYSEYREHRLKRIMETSSAKDGSKKYWRAKAALSKIQVYKDNPTYEAFERWSTGYGLYGAQPVYHVVRWDPMAPPEVLCDPIVATVTAIWAARGVQGKCASTGFGDSYEIVNRGYSSGHCKLNPSWAKYFRRRADRVGLDYKKRARLGTAWPRKTTDRKAIYARMEKVLEESDAEFEKKQRAKAERLAKRKRPKRKKRTSRTKT